MAYCEMGCKECKKVTLMVRACLGFGTVDSAAGNNSRTGSTHLSSLVCPNSGIMTILQDLHRLRFLLTNLPQGLPCPQTVQTSGYKDFINFTPDPVQIEYTGDKASAVSTQLKSIFGWQARTTGDGIIVLTERGEALCSVVDVLSTYITKYPENNVLKKWVQDIINAAEKIFQGMGVPVHCQC